MWLALAQGLLLLLFGQNLDAVVGHDFFEGLNAAKHLHGLGSSLCFLPTRVLRSCSLPALASPRRLDQVQHHLLVQLVCSMCQHSKFVYNYLLELSKCFDTSFIIATQLISIKD